VSASVFLFARTAAYLCSGGVCGGTISRFSKKSIGNIFTSQSVSERWSNSVKYLGQLNCVWAFELRSLSQEVVDQLAVVFVFDSREESGAEFSDRFGFVERQAIVHLSATEVAGHTFRFEDWFELRVEVDMCCWRVFRWG